MGKEMKKGKWSEGEGRNKLSWENLVLGRDKEKTKSVKEVRHEEKMLPEAGSVYILNYLDLSDFCT